MTTTRRGIYGEGIGQAGRTLASRSSCRFFNLVHTSISAIGSITQEIPQPLRYALRKTNLLIKTRTRVAENALPCESPRSRRPPGSGGEHRGTVSFNGASRAVTASPELADWTSPSRSDHGTRTREGCSPCRSPGAATNCSTHWPHSVKLPVRAQHELHDPSARDATQVSRQAPCDRGLDEPS